MTRGRAERGPSERKFGGMGIAEAKKLRALETENGRLKKLLAESQLENMTQALGAQM